MKNDDSRLRGRNGSEFCGTLQIEYLWYPFLPLNEYTVIFGQSGTGKTFYISLISAYVTRGWKFPWDMQEQEVGDVLYITGEETFEEITDRLIKAGGDPKHLTVIDRSESLGLNINSGFSELAQIVEGYKPKLIILDPWQSFIGDAVDMNRQNQLRPMLQKISLLAGKSKSAIILVSHVNKREQGQDASNAVSGSGELVNASRSAIKLIEDEEDVDRRIAIHTKSNHAKRGLSLCFRFDSDGGVQFDGTSDITKSTLEQAARARKSPTELKRSQQQEDDTRVRLIDALLTESENTEQCGKRLTYQDLKLKYGNDIFGAGQAKRILDSVADEMKCRGVFMETGKKIGKGKTTANGIFIQRIISSSE